MPDHRIEKGRHRGGELESGELAQQIGEGLLENIQRIGPVRRKTPGKAVDPVAVTVVKGLESFGIAPICQFNQFMVGFQGRSPLAPKKDHTRTIARTTKRLQIVYPLLHQFDKRQRAKVLVLTDKIVDSGNFQILWQGKMCFRLCETAFGLSAKVPRLRCR